MKSKVDKTRKQINGISGRILMLTFPRSHDGIGMLRSVDVFGEVPFPEIHFVDVINIVSFGS